MNEQDEPMEEEEDDIIEELHRIRWAIFEEAGGTPEAYGRYYVEMGKKRLAAEAAAAQRAQKKSANPAKPARAKRPRKVAVL